MEGIVFDISRYCLDDGPGIRTTVYMKGCPLRCIWCHNPESYRIEPEIGFDVDKCVGCGACISGCLFQCHEINSGMHRFHRERCDACGKCVDACAFDALTAIGRHMTVDQVISTVERDYPFYEASGGGLTISGGEPLYQPEFTKALLVEAHKRGISTCIETSGFACEAAVLDIASHVDLFLYDCKHTDTSMHKEVTGVDNSVILNNLHKLDEMGKYIVLRLPIIPGINDNHSHFAKVGELANTLSNILYLEVMPYHPLGLSKAARLQKKMPYEATELPTPQTVDKWVEEIQKNTSKNVIHAKS